MSVNAYPDDRIQRAKRWTKKQLLTQYLNADRLVWALTAELAKEREKRKEVVK